ncbi:MAG TPA: ABC transporter ATP-binding protein [Pseudolabrys sp.]|nr:ABC transporter ATP-binding protein [Pseudolabrys sp.]
MLNKVADPDASMHTAQGEIAVRLDGVTKRFGQVTALHEVNLSIRRGELMTLLGPSGCGKTTLLNLIAGFFMPSGGEILIDGMRVNHLPTYKREIGMMFQNYALFPHMTVAANIGYGLRMRGIAKAEIVRRVSDALALVKLAGLEDRKPSQLSGGQQQRVAIARALVINPRVLLLDEPFSALDKSLRASMQVELKDLQRKLGVTTIFVTHDQSEALSLSDRITVMSEGKVLQVDTPEEIYRRPGDRFVASFIGDINVLRGRIEEYEGERAKVSVGEASFQVSAAPLGPLSPGAPVDLFVRSEHLKPASGAPTVAAGRISAVVYQGGHTDVYVDTPAAVSGKLLLRLSDNKSGRWEIGAEIKIAADGGDAVAFRAS